MKQNSHELAAAFGFLYPGEVHALKRLAEMTPEDGGVIVNIGAGAGTSSLAMREARPASTMYTVDISKGGPHGGMENEINAFRLADMEHLLPVQVLGDSARMGQYWAFEKADLVFVDGDHSDLGLRADIEAWLPNLKPGGIMAFHDYERDVWPAVQAVVDELMAGFEQVLHVDTLIAFRVSNVTSD